MTTMAANMMGRPAAPTPYGYCVLDIETGNGRPEGAEHWMRVNWSPSPNWKAETIGKRYLEALERKRERMALLETAPIICVALKSDTELRCLHAMGAHDPRVVEGGGLVEGFGDMAGMLLALRCLLDAMMEPEAPLVGHNIRGFDLPRLRLAYLRNGLRLPVCLAQQNQATFDTMLEYGRRFGGGRDAFVSLDDVLEAFGLESHKGLIDGKDVPTLHAAGQAATIVRYAMLDVLAEAEVFERMTGAARGLK